MANIDDAGMHSISINISRHHSPHSVAQNMSTMEESKGLSNRSSLSPQGLSTLRQPALKKAMSTIIPPSAVKLAGQLSASKKKRPLCRSPKKPIVAPKVPPTN